MTKPKVKRPYKISDIHNLDISLPKTFIVEASRTPKPTSDAILTRIRAMDQNNVIISKEINKIEDSKMIQSSDIEETLHEDMPDCHSPVQEMLEPSTDFNIDQSMFNPKTLLQCFSKQDPDLIITPPAEFCDSSASIYSPIQSKDNYDYHHLDNTGTYDDIDEPPYECVNYLNPTTEAFLEHDRSIFEENIQQNNILTPTKEIETWTLSQDDSQHNPYLQCSGLKSYTIMRNNSPIDRPASTSHSLSRSAKLCEFKLKHKSKLRM